MKFLLASFAVSALLTALVIGLARRFRWRVPPRPDRWSQRTVAKFGGVPIILTLLGSAVCLPLDRRLTAIVALTALMSVLGFLDDLFHLSAIQKLAAQILLSVGATGLGVSYPLSENPYLNGLYTVAWLVGITNAVNIIDNMDGLAAGVAAIALANLIFLPGAGAAASTLMLAMTGAVSGFLVFNFYPARIFMGDTGSLGVGFFLGCGSVLMTERFSGALSIVAIPVLVLFLPVFDAVLVSATRRRNGRRVAAGAKDHTSHRLVLLGMGERQAVLLLYLVSAGAGGLASLWKSDWHRLGAGMAVLCLGMAAMAWLYLARMEMPASWLSERRAVPLAWQAVLSRMPDAAVFRDALLLLRRYSLTARADSRSGSAGDLYWAAPGREFPLLRDRNRKQPRGPVIAIGSQKGAPSDFLFGLPIRRTADLFRLLARGTITTVYLLPGCPASAGQRIASICGAHGIPVSTLPYPLEAITAPVSGSRESANAFRPSAGSD